MSASVCAMNRNRPLGDYELYPPRSLCPLSRCQFRKRIMLRNCPIRRQPCRRTPSAASSTEIERRVQRAAVHPGLAAGNDLQYLSDRLNLAAALTGAAFGAHATRTSPDHFIATAV